MRAFDRDGNEFTFTRTGMTARAICHECDHLDGVTIMDLAEYFYEDQERRKTRKRTRRNDPGRGGSEE